MKKPIKLSDIEKKQPFLVPDNYFKELTDRVMERCRKEERSQSFVHILKPALSLAALFIAVALIAYFAVNKIEQTGQSPSYKQQDIAKAEHTRQFSSQEELMESLKDSHKDAGKKETDEYIDYLLEENIDYGILIKELKEKKQDQ